MTSIPEAFSLTGRKALVTGASGGVGRHFARVLAEAGAYVILAGRQAEPYHVSKAGVIQLTKTLAPEFARFKVRVNAIAPGSFPTEMTAGFWDSDEGKAMLQRIPQRRLGAVCKTWMDRFCCWPRRPLPT